MTREEAYKLIGGSRQETGEAVLAYNAVLEITKDIFGDENMTPEIMVAAIEAGSYMAWRAIMGAKDAGSYVPPKAGRRISVSSTG